MSRNARFHVWANGDWAKLTVREGETLSWGSFNRHDEGWNHYGETWQVINGTLYSTTVTDGVDCDGRMSSYDEHFAEVDKIHPDTDNEGNAILRVTWERSQGGQRDYAAEAMGY